MADTFTPTRARKNRVKLRLNIQGPSGSGKTKGAIALACSLAEIMAVARGARPDEAKVCVVDTENESALLYADEYVFDHIPLDAPYTSERYKAAIRAAAGYDVVVVDSFSHWWKGEGGILTRKDEYDRKNQGKGNSYTNWGQFDPEILGMVEFIKHLPMHAIYTTRSKTDIVLQDVGDKKNVPVKVGMKAVLKDDMDYEFDIVFEVEQNHNAKSSKDRSQLFSGKDSDLLNPEVAAAIHDWATNGKEAEIRKISPEDRRRIFASLQANKVSPEDFKDYLVENYNTGDSQEIPASAVAAIVKWIESAKEASQAEKIGRQSMAALKLSRQDAAMLIAKHNRNWDAINLELDSMPIPDSKPAATQAAPPAKPEFEGEWEYEAPQLDCMVLEITRREAAGNREYVTLKVNGRIGGKDQLTCWHKSLFNALSLSKGMFCRLIVDQKNDHTVVEDVLMVGEQAYQKGKAYVPSSEKINPTSGKSEMVDENGDRVPE